MVHHAERCTTHTTNADELSQLRFSIFISDGDSSNLLHYRSSKARRLVRSPLAAETHALEEAADMAILTQYNLFYIDGIMIPITLLIDSKSLFDVFSSWTMTSEKRFMI